MKRIIFSICNVIVFYVSCIAAAPTTILWDVGGILFKPNTLGIFRDVIGITNPACYYLKSLQTLSLPVSLRKQAFTILYSMQGYQECTEHQKVRDNNGIELPHIMVDWLNGKQSYTDILAAVNTHLDELEQQHYFVNSAHKETLKSIFSVMFEPTILGRYMAPIQEGYVLLHASIKAGYNNIILSNFDTYTFDYLYNSPHGQKVFAGIPRDNIIISGECGMSKPDSNIFIYTLNKYNLRADECIFIDDQLENIKAAQECGITAIHVPHQNFDTALQLLVEARSATT